MRRSRKPYLRYGRIVTINDVEMKVLVESKKIKRLRVGSQQVGKLLLLHPKEAEDENVCMHTVHLSRDGHFESSDCVFHASEQIDTKRELLTMNDEHEDESNDERLSEYDTRRNGGNTSRCVAVLLELIGLMSFESSSSSNGACMVVRRRKVIV